MKTNILAGIMMISVPPIDTSFLSVNLRGTKAESFNRLSQKGRRKRAKQAKSRK